MIWDRPSAGAGRGQAKLGPMRPVLARQGTDVETRSRKARAATGCVAVVMTGSYWSFASRASVSIANNKSGGSQRLDHPPLRSTEASSASEDQEDVFVCPNERCRPPQRSPVEARIEARADRSRRRARLGQGQRRQGDAERYLPAPAELPAAVSCQRSFKGGRVFGMREPAAECLVLARVHEAARPACRVVGDAIDVAVLATAYRPFIPMRPAASLAFCLAVGVSNGDILCTAALAPEVRCR